MAGNQIPHWLNGFLNQDDLLRIEKAVTRAESHTAAEIVPLIVRRSSAIGHLPLTIFSLLSFVTLVILWPFHDLVDAAYGDFWLPVLLLFWLVVAFPLSRMHRVQRLLIPDIDEDFQSQRRAWAEFAANRISSKQSRRGVLLFVSMMERKAVFLVDEGLLSLFSPTDLEHAAADFGRRLHDLPWGQAFEETIDELAEKLGKALPRDAGSRDELGNRLQMKE